MRLPSLLSSPFGWFSCSMQNVAQPFNISSNRTEFLEFAVSSTSEWIHRVILILYFLFGFIGNGLNILLFSRHALIRTSTSIYLLSASISNMLVITLVVPYRLFADGYNLDPSSASLLACRMISYLNFVLLAIPPYFNVLACADRWAATSIQVSRRRFADIHRAKKSVSLPILLAFILYAYVLVTFSCEAAPPPPFCSIDEAYAAFGLSFYLIIYTIIPPGLMVSFSSGIMYNVYHKQDRIAPAVQTAHPSNGDRHRAPRPHLPHHHFSQMQLMLVCQAIVECLCTLPFSMINLISLAVSNDASFLSTYAYLRLLIFFNYVSSF